MKTNFADKVLKEARLKKGLTQSEVAELAGISLRNYQRFEDGMFPKYKSDTIGALDRILGIQIHDMIYDNLLSDPEEPYYEKRAKPENSPIPNEITQLVNSNAILAESNKKLVDMLHSTAGFQKDKDLATSAMFRGLLDGMADVATGKEYNSKSEALRGLSKQIHEYVSAILIADNHGEKGKKHT